VTNFSFSEYFHWTPKQVKELDEIDKINYISLMNGMSKAKPKEK